MTDIQFPVTPALMTVEQFAKWHGISESTVRACLRGDSTSYPPLRSKRTKPGKGGLIYITAEAAAKWRASLPDA